MPQIMLSELADIMRECAGWAQSLEEAPDESFLELGYDSLALMETHSRINRDYGVGLSEDELGSLRTPRELVDFVNTLIAGR